MQHENSSEGPNPSGLCLCGCGQTAPIAKISRRVRGDVAGYPVRFILGHHGNPNRKCRACKRILPKSEFAMREVGGKTERHIRCKQCQGAYEASRPPIINSTPLCACGCGRPVNIAKRSYRKDGIVRGRPYKYLKGHWAAATFPVQAMYVVNPETDCWEWQRIVNESGYAQMSVRGKTVIAHRWFWEQSNGPIPKGFEVHHRCNNSLCVNPDHLEALPVVEHRRKSRGTILTVEIVEEIKSTAGVVSGKEWARRLGVSDSTISSIRTGKNWRDV